MLLNIKELKEREACKESIEFFKRNYPNGLDLNMFQVCGDYRLWKYWLNYELGLKFSHDNNGKRIKAIDKQGSVWKYEYDDHGRRIKTIYPDGTIWEYSYVNGKKKIKITNKRSVDEYNEFGHRVKEILKDGKVNTWSYTYDKWENVTSIMKNSTTVIASTKYKYDEFDRVIEIVNELTGEKESYQYDPRGNIILIRNITEDEEIVTKFNFVFRNNLLMEIYQDGQKICWLEEKEIDYV